MKKSYLYQTANHDKEHILRILRATYANQILSEMNRLMGSADRDMIESVLNDVYVRLPEISSEYDVSLLVNDCVRIAAGLGSALPKNNTSDKSDKGKLYAISERIGRRHRRIAKYAIPISVALLLLTLLWLYYFPPF